MQPADQTKYLWSKESSGQKKPFSSPASSPLAVVSLAFTACVLAWVLWYCRYGFDLTDEGFYLNWISRPFNYPESNSQFGFLYHPLYLLVKGDIAMLRQANLLITYILALTAGWVLLGRIFGTQALVTIDRFSVAAAMATSALVSVVFLGMWLPTPSYNTLAFQGLLTAVTGIFMATKEATRESILGWSLIGVGGWLTFMGKPTSAAVLALITAIYLLSMGRIRILQLVVAVGAALGLLVLSALLIDGSITGYIDRNWAGLQIARMFVGSDAASRIFRLGKLSLAGNAWQVLLLITTTVFLSLWLAQLKIERFQHAGLVLATLLVTFGFLITFRYIPLHSISAQHRGLMMFAILSGVAIAGVSMYSYKGLRQIDRTQWTLFLCVLVMPYAYAFGTGNDYWIPIGAAVVFMVFAGILLLGPLAFHHRLGSMLVMVGLSAQIMASVLINGGFSFPYRQPHPLYENRAEMKMRQGGGSLLLSERHAHYISAVMRIADRSGFQAGGPMIDLSGHSPGVVYALGANSIGVAWSLGGYPGTREFVIHGLRTVSCEQLVAAWILTEPRGPRPVPQDVLSSFGANLELDYQIAGEMISPEGQTQYLKKPSRDTLDALQACEAARANAS